MTIELFIAIWVIFAGVSRFIDSFAEKKAKAGKGWIWSLVCGILLVLFGMVFLVWPVVSAFVITEFVGILTAVAFIILGIMGIAGALTSVNVQLPPPSEIFGNDNEPPRPA